ncbi:hypothetical protein GM708_05640 [Vibrio cholerae]|nr:hypothetical protein [Vibrio cholerae]
MQNSPSLRTALRHGVRAAASAATLALIAGCSLLPSSAPDRDADGAVIAQAETDVFAVQVGDCINDPGTESVTDITVLPCGELHDFEAFAATLMPDGEYPGDAAATTAATEFCAAEFTAFVGLDYDASVLEMMYFYPVEESWNATDDREILCLVADEGEAPVAGTLEDAGK